MTDKQIIIDGFNLEYIKELLYNGQRSAITTNIFEAIIEELERKEQECEELKNFHINLVGVKECEIRELVKYKQALTEIKNIVETCNSGINCSECPYTEECKTDTEAEALGVCKLVLQKCEVINEHN